MRWVTAYAKKLQIQEKSVETPALRPIDFQQCITSHSIHELLFHPSTGNALPFFPALLATQSALNRTQKAEPHLHTPRMLTWVDSTGTFYPPAAIAQGVSPNQLCVLRPRQTDLIWATIECLRCQGVGAVVSLMMQRPTRVQVRQLQLAAEKGGGVGLLLRPNLASAGSHIYAATTRWLVAPAPGERTIQRWRIQLLHGHGRRIGQTFLLEKHRATGQTNLVPLSSPLAHHPLVSAAS